ncbi:DUF5984 family protein [Saccharibacillus sp. O23]|uniref:DUF5984 family protein n=1 Tax=Saccharibacillus sp. O23 TaxID=2009338 RepID=UPI00359415E4
MVLIRYKLKNWRDIQPWGDENPRVLYWFGLTDCYYWFDFKEIRRGFKKHCLSSLLIIKDHKGRGDKILNYFLYAAAISGVV